MQVLWQQSRSFVKDILEDLPDPKPAYNTVATIMKILHQKGFVDFKSYGNAYQYYPLINREEYYSKYLKGLVARSFNNSLRQMISMFTRQNQLDLREADEIIQLMEQLKKSNDD